MWHVDHRGDGGDTVQSVRPAQRGLGLPVAAMRPVAGPDPLAILKHRLDAAMSGGADPFSDAQPAAAAAAAAPVQPAVAEPPPAVPAIPFTYVGRWQEQGRTLVFLRAGDHVVTVSGPGPVEGSYVVEAIGDESLTLKLPDGRTQVLSFAAPAAGAPAAAMPAVQTTAATPPQMEDN